MSVVPTIDGPQILGIIKDDGCCPPNLCNIDYCGFICAFLQYLPRGPIWDYWRNARQQDIIDTNGACVIDNQHNNPCVTIIDHAIYTARKLFYILQNPLQTAIWEADPLTAFNTRDYWLTKYGWEDCFDGPSAYSQLGFPTPYQAVCNALLPTSPCTIESTLYQMSPTINGNQNPVVDISALVKAACPPNLLLAVKYGILVALKRLEIGIIPTQEIINFILEPLGVRADMTSILPTDCAEDCNQMFMTVAVPCVMQYDCNQMTGTGDCGPRITNLRIVLSLLNGGKIASGPGITEPLTCSTVQKLGSEKIDAFYHFDGVEMPVTTECPAITIAGDGTIYPALMAAECILLSLIPPNISYTITRSV